MATGSVNETSGSAPTRAGPGLVNQIQLDWTSDASGNVRYTVQIVVGLLLRVVFAPGGGGAQPSDAYDATLLDEHGIDVLAGQGANLSNSAVSHVCPGVPLKDGTTTSTMPIAVNGPLTLVIAAAGNAKSGSMILYYK